MDKPSISIVIPVYNAAAYLDRCLESVIKDCERFASQNGGLYAELLLADDGSTDGSLSICRRYASAYDHVSLFQLEHGGVSRARNAGIENCRGKYLYFLDADDYMMEGCLEGLFSYAESNELQFVFSDILKIDFDGGLIANEFYEENKILAGGQIDRFLLDYLEDPRKNNLISFVWNKLFLTSLVKEARICFSEELPVNEDALFVFEYLSRADRIGFFHQATYCYCTNQENIGTHRMMEFPLAYARSLDVIRDRLLSKGVLRGEEISRNYHQALASLAIRNLFHMIRCHRGRWSQLYRAVRAVLVSPLVAGSIPFYDRSGSENFRVIPFLIRRKWAALLILAFRAQIALRRIRR